jgi:hypothetical protein
MGEERTGEPQANQRLTVAQAAAALDITEGAVRIRIKRGTLPTVKEGGTVYVVLSGTSEAKHPPHTDEPSDQSELVESLQDQVTYLRQQLDAEREAGRRKDHLLAAALNRIPAVEAPQEPQESPEGAGEAPDTTEPPSATEGTQEPTSPRRGGVGCLGRDGSKPQKHIGVDRPVPTSRD